MRAVVIPRFGDGKVLTAIDVGAGHRRIESGRSTGKLVLTVKP
jgi:hypothetical protein